VAKRQVLDAFEGAYLEALLDRHGGNISASARAAGIDRKTIQRMLKRHISEG
jgi:two-component system response regulator AtoC